MSRIYNYDTNNIRVVRDNDNITFYSKEELSVSVNGLYLIIKDGLNVVETLLYSEITVPESDDIDDLMLQIQVFIEEYVAPATPPTTEDLAQRVDDSTTPNTVYIGYAALGSLEADPVWRMKKIDTTSGADTTWADGDDSYDNIWNDRTTLTYL